MAALIRGGFVLVSLLIGGTAVAQCNFSNNEISNPFEPGCGDRQLTFVESATGDPDDVPLGYPVPVPVASTAPVDGFRTYDSLFANQQDLMLLHPEVDGTVIGSTLAGEDIWAYRIGTQAQTTVFGEPKGSVLINGGIHAREWQTPEVLAETFERLVAGRHDGGFVQYLVDNLAVYLIPVHNVDGFKQTQAHPDRSTAHPAQPRDGRMRRKNLRFSAGGTVDANLTTVPDNFDGVDLNRNHPIGFRSQPNNSQTRSLIYAGSAAHSEPETQALVAAAQLADPGRLRMYIDVHSFSQIYFTPQTGNAARDQNTGRLATAMRAVTNNKYRYSPDAVGTDIGTTASWFAGTFQVPAWTLETEPLNGPQDYGGLPYGHGGFVAPDAEIARIRDELARTLLLGFYRQAGPPSIVAAEVRDTAGTLVWSVDWRSNGDGTRTQETGIDDSLVPGGEYTLWVAFDKPMRWRDEGGAVSQFAGQSTSLAPTVALEYRDGNDITRVPITTEAADWRDQAGDEGLLNYADDAFVVDFTVPADAPTTATEAVFTVETADMTGFHLDTEPDTVAGWSNGAWTGYEGVDGTAQVMSSGPDCSLRLWIGSGTRGQHTLTCSAREAAEPDPPPANPDPPSGGGGGGRIEWMLLVLLSVLALVRRSVPVRPRARRPVTSDR